MSAIKSNQMCLASFFTFNKSKYQTALLRKKDKTEEFLRWKKISIILEYKESPTLEKIRDGHKFWSKVDNILLVWMRKFIRDWQPFLFKILKQWVFHLYIMLISLFLIQPINFYSKNPMG